MPATRDGKLWRSQFYYKDWQGVRRKKNKRGFKTKGEADEWERNFLQQQQKNLDISFENFVEIYFADMENRLRESTIINKRYEMVRGIKETGVRRIRLHDLRHSHASLLVEMGFQPLAIAERLGHEKIETTLNTYSHLYPNKQAELAEKLEIANGEE